MPEYIERGAAYADFEKCNAENPKWTPGRVKALIARYAQADVAPVRHGRWSKFYKSGNKVEEGFVSSCCDMWNERRSPFCPNCGALMDGDG